MVAGFMNLFSVVLFLVVRNPFDDTSKQSTEQVNSVISVVKWAYLLLFIYVWFQYASLLGKSIQISEWFSCACLVSQYLALKQSHRAQVGLNLSLGLCVQASRCRLCTLYQHCSQYSYYTVMSPCISASVKCYLACTKDVLSGLVSLAQFAQV